MTELTQIKSVDRAVIDEVVRRIVECVRPQKIILFGSYAYGRPHADSDLDILVVMESELPRYKRAVPIYYSGPHKLDTKTAGSKRH
jgi:predicted nucleotidyltransferase